MNSMAPAEKTMDKSLMPGKGAKKPSASNAAAPLGARIVDYLNGVRSEWTKISWPTWPQIWGQTIVVLVMVSIMTLGLFLMDSLFSILRVVLTTGKLPS